MSKAPEFVVTGLHVPKVHFWARVLVGPDRLAQVREGILHRGNVYLDRGDILEIETECGDEKGLALRVNTHPDDGRIDLLPTGFCLVAWNGVAGDINIYGDNQDEFAAMYAPILDALLYRDRVGRGHGFLDANKITSIVVGGVTVFFERDGTKDEAEPDDDRDEAYRASIGRQAGLKAALAAEKLVAMKLQRFKPARRAA
ncbi:hypothetical protein [Methylobacterium sp. WL7]|jgi:hypothetical protein|uniref:hypothetical protein n=1 Tax=Methylobacterium sp. WL7 TaxID=2603900 RepID=UPI0011CB8F24|nr:hypothetical protein [Methylobacterium sp. WL7]TXN47345.1 hypothetical protein FV233_04765 [Methylobacterium sp. WL7]